MENAACLRLSACTANRTAVASPLMADNELCDYTSDRVEKFLTTWYPNIHDLYKSALPEIALSSVYAEAERHCCNINLIAPESLIPESLLASSAALNLVQSVELTGGRHWFPHHDWIDTIIKRAGRIAEQVFGMSLGSAEPHSATQANQAVLLGCLKPQGKVFSMALAHGGHVSHGHRGSLCHQLYDVRNYFVADHCETVDYDAIEKAVTQYQPDVIISGSSSYPRQLDFATLSDIAQKVDALHLADISHIAGLIAAKLHPDASSADAITFSTHKTLLGPRGGIVLSRDRLSANIRKAVSPGLQSALFPNVLLGKLLTLRQAQTADFRSLQEDIVKNAKSLAQGFAEAGVDVVTKGTDTHLVLVRVPRDQEAGRLCAKLATQRILCNANFAPGDSLKSGPTGLRFGTTVATQLGLSPATIRSLGNAIGTSIQGGDCESLRAEVDSLLELVLEKRPSQGSPLTIS